MTRTKSLIIDGTLKVYADPAGIEDGAPIADVVLITRNHPDHCSIPDVAKISRPSTIVVGPADVVCRFRLNQLPLEPGQTKSVLGLPVTAAAAPEGLSYVVEHDGEKIEVGK
jgi:L-ascorbate metabolism protein UlaG (beta-lactamase superfamily)